MLRTTRLCKTRLQALSASAKVEPYLSHLLDLHCPDMRREIERLVVHDQMYFVVPVTGWQMMPTAAYPLPLCNVRSVPQWFRAWLPCLDVKTGILKRLARVLGQHCTREARRTSFQCISFSPLAFLMSVLRVAFMARSFFTVKIPGRPRVSTSPRL